MERAANRRAAALAAALSAALARAAARVEGAVGARLGVALEPVALRLEAPGREAFHADLQALIEGGISEVTERHVRVAERTELQWELRRRGVCRLSRYWARVPRTRRVVETFTAVSYGVDARAVRDQLMAAVDAAVCATERSLPPYVREFVRRRVGAARGAAEEYGAVYLDSVRSALEARAAGADVHAEALARAAAHAEAAGALHARAAALAARAEALVPREAAAGAGGALGAFEHVEWPLSDDEAAAAAPAAFFNAGGAVGAVGAALLEASPGAAGAGCAEEARREGNTAWALSPPRPIGEAVEAADFGAGAGCAAGSCAVLPAVLHPSPLVAVEAPVAVKAAAFECLAAGQPLLTAAEAQEEEEQQQQQQQEEEQVEAAAATSAADDEDAALAADLTAACADVKAAAGAAAQSGSGSGSGSRASSCALLLGSDEVREAREADLAASGLLAMRPLPAAEALRQQEQEQEQEEQQEEQQAELPAAAPAAEAEAAAEPPQPAAVRAGTSSPEDLLIPTGTAESSGANEALANSLLSSGLAVTAADEVSAAAGAAAAPPALPLSLSAHGAQRDAGADGASGGASGGAASPARPPAARLEAEVDADSGALSPGFDLARSFAEALSAARLPAAPAPAPLVAARGGGGGGGGGESTDDGEDGFVLVAAPRDGTGSGSGSGDGSGGASEEDEAAPQR